jgi:hypothetical protein
MRRTPKISSKAWEKARIPAPPAVNRRISEKQRSLVMEIKGRRKNPHTRSIQKHSYAPYEEQEKKLKVLMQMVAYNSTDSGLDAFPSDRTVFLNEECCRVQRYFFYAR